MDWAPSITTTSLFAAALWLSRNMIAERLKNSVKHEFDVKLEKVRAEIRASEGHLNAVRSTALAALASGQTALNERRLRAIEDVWGVTMALKSGTSLVNVIGLLNLDNVAKHLRDGDPATQQFVRFIQTFGEGFGDRLKKSKDASSARPFLSPMAWAFYTAYSSIVTLAFVQMEALKAGGEPLPFVKTEPRSPQR